MNSLRGEGLDPSAGRVVRRFRGMGKSAVAAGINEWPVPEKAVTPPADLGARVDRYRCCRAPGFIRCAGNDAVATAGINEWPVPEKAVAPPADLGARIDRYRCCLPALAGFST